MVILFFISQFTENLPITPRQEAEGLHVISHLRMVKSMLKIAPEKHCKNPIPRRDESQGR